MQNFSGATVVEMNARNSLNRKVNILEVTGDFNKEQFAKGGYAAYSLITLQV